ncbi:MAG TPA: metalloregulator ArsR/SmtB family transcription factor [Chloroflexota bacterium]|jgi:DNA-binding transcriptional ArsR family regulator|nr:metalloregulator ArsR/SmtB family transcription factor [Chloroflexota bacterium]
MDAALKALAHPGRRAILRLVWDAELTAGELAERAGMTKPGASQHLRLLREAGLVRVRVAANRRLYRVDQERMTELRAFLDDFWSGPLARLKAMAEARARASGEHVGPSRA